ncbi:hypothetical protein NEDG_01616 [Nematocida displodere]|uniref:mRNA-capping enzyme subunit beta n=1 Tax=Nematocida displodere TaxID=1805483 RepID=A0A177EGV9_9MICR|nr:hypothetical protein NEDG_01616 [Nematocida displodere]
MALEDRAVEETAHIVRALLSSLPDTLSKTTEVEIRLGTLIDKATNNRLSIEFMHPSVIKRADTLRFQATVHHEDFKSLVAHFSKEIEEKEDKKIIDSLIKGFRRSETIEVNGQPAKQKPVLIQKKKMKMIDIFCPNSKYDIRIGISEEIVKEDTLTLPVVQAVREKTRTTFKTDMHLIEATEVLSGRDANSLTEKLYEVELEAISSKYTKEEFVKTAIAFMATLDRVLGRQ